LHEHPRDEDSWNLPEIKELERDRRAYKVTGPMCRWEMKAVDNNSFEGYVRKETSFLTSSKEVADMLSGKCANTLGHGVVHRHFHLVGGDRARMAAEYPVKMVAAVLIELCGGNWYWMEKCAQ